MKAIMDPLCYKIIGAGMQVHRELGYGFLENVYHEALMIEFQKRQIPFRHEAEIPIHYKGIPLKTVYRADFICFDDIIVEIKAVELLSGIHIAQALNYVKATGASRAVLLNFGSSSLEYRRVANKFL